MTNTNTTQATLEILNTVARRRAIHRLLERGEPLTLDQIQSKLATELDIGLSRLTIKGDARELFERGLITKDEAIPARFSAPDPMTAERVLEVATRWRTAAEIEAEYSKRYDVDDPIQLAKLVPLLLAMAAAKKLQRRTLSNGTFQWTIRPVVGMGATVCHYTDRNAATIVSVSTNGSKVVTRDDKATRTDTNGMSETQSYTYEPDPNGTERVFRLQGNGTYRAAGGGPPLALNVRRTYHDYSF